MSPPQFADVTVIMPAYRAARTIGRALDSVTRQSLRPKAVVVVDDGSDDGTAAAAESMRSVLDGIELRILSQPNLGAGAARNRALAAAETTWVAFLDADDEWLPDKLSRSMPYLEHQDVELVSHDYIAVSEGRERRIDCTRHFDLGKDVFSALFRRGFISTSTVVARRATLVAAGGFDETLRAAQDYELWLRVAMAGNDAVVVFREPLMRYHVTSGSITTLVELRRQCGLRIAWRHMPSLSGRTHHPFAVACTRTAIIAWEAARAHFDASRPLAMIWACARLPTDLLRTARQFAAPGAS